MTTNCHKNRGPARDASISWIAPSPPSDGGEGQGRGGPCSCAAPPSIANLKSKIENSPPTRRPVLGVRTVLGRSNLPRTENLDQLTRLLAYRRCSNPRSAYSLPSVLSAIALATVEALMTKDGLLCCIAGCQSSPLIGQVSLQNTVRTQ